MHVDFSELMLNPHAVVDALFANAATAPARIQPLAADDVDYFVEACRCVNFPFFLLGCCARTSDQWSSSTRWETVDSRAHRQRGRKPAPFIPVIDAELQFWFKKDSLWQSEMLDAVVDSDVGRVAILQVTTRSYLQLFIRMFKSSSIALANIASQVAECRAQSRFSTRTCPTSP